MTSKDTSIEWTEKSWQVTRGCSRESPGCQHCYAEDIAVRFSGPGKPFEQVIHPRHKKWNGTLLALPESLAGPFSWRKPSKVFVNSMSDLFHESVPDDYIAAVFAVMGMARQHTFQVLTKRASRMRHWFDALPLAPWHSVLYPALKKYLGPEEFSKLIGRVIDVRWPFANVGLGVSVEDHQRAEERIPELLQCPAAVRFLSCEPLLGPVNLDSIKYQAGMYGWLSAFNDGAWPELGKVHWVIVGGESGPQARPMALEWAQAIVRACQEDGTPVFVKQLGRHPYIAGAPADWPISDRRGAVMAEWPESLRVREFPQSVA